MGYTPKILAFAGSTRVESFNKKRLSVEKLGRELTDAMRKLKG
jgi:NAD(P)H-dependent FMN reductase